MPGRVKLLRLFPPIPRRPMRAEPAGEGDQPTRRIRHQRRAAMLRRVKSVDVEIENAAPRLGEQRARAGGEILQPGADGEDHIRLGGQRIGG